MRLKNLNACPRCGSTDFIGDGVDYLATEEVHVGGKCHACGNTWTIVMRPVDPEEESPTEQEGKKMDKNPNTNCLTNRRCPQCDSYGPFRIVVVGWAKLGDNGYEDVFDIEEQDGSPWVCAQCNYTGTDEEFADFPKREARMPSVEFGEDTDYDSLTLLLWIMNGKSNHPADATTWEFHMAGGAALYVGQYVDAVDDKIQIRIGDSLDPETRPMRWLNMDEIEKIVYL